MDIEIDEGEAGGEFGDDGDDDDTSALYFSVSLWRAKSLLGNNAGADHDQMRKHINKYSLPHEPQLKLQET